jgi:hypothetical protein
MSLEIAEIKELLDVRAATFGNCVIDLDRIK